MGGRRREVSSIIDVGSVALAYYLVVRWHVGGLSASHGLYLTLFPFVGLVWWILSLVMRRDLPYRLGGLLVEIRETVVLNAVGGILLFAFSLMAHQLLVSRLVLGGFPVLGCLLSVTARVLMREYLAIRRRRGFDAREVLLVGPTTACLSLGRGLLREGTGLRPAGLLIPDGEGTDVGSVLPILGRYSDLPDILHTRVIDQVAIAASLDDPSLRFLVEDSLLEGKTVLWSMDAFAARLLGRGTGQVVLLSPEPDSLGLAGKRLLDVAISGLSLLALSPVMAACALAVKLDDPAGPAFFRQTRVGLHGRPFTCYKFRSMVRDAERRRAELASLNEMDGPVFKVRNDPRITRVGRFLRKYSLDELPQLWNVLVGQMSLVGPRPPLPSEVAEYQPDFRRRLAFRPGLTCLWQVSGRNNVDFKRWMELDLKYVDNWSFGLDLYILLRTIPVVLFGSGV